MIKIQSNKYPDLKDNYCEINFYGLQEHCEEMKALAKKCFENGLINCAENAMPEKSNLMIIEIIEENDKKQGAIIN